ncbi:unnamed protein product [Cercopithifilaria johnstoni]|uniref:Uncharacterized protein n=1 Tax=Cercopithifilaria johnstoni TaxID=2874296 RepID=A0A8J2M938_9BILA|nr:unnamed protein product [Cercopithifilaria johnstoni]
MVQKSNQIVPIRLPLADLIFIVIDGATNLSMENRPAVPRRPIVISPTHSNTPTNYMYVLSTEEELFPRMKAEFLGEKCGGNILRRSDIRSKKMTAKKNRFNVTV